MKALVDSPWTARLGILAALYVLFWLWSDVDYPNPRAILFNKLPLFHSEPNVEVFKPNQTDKSYGVTWPYRVFKSSPCRPPYFEDSFRGGELAEGYLIFTPKERVRGGTKQNMPLIIGQDNEPVYCHDDPINSNNFRVQMLNGEPHLTVWSGESVSGHGYGNLVIMDDGYDRIVAMLNEALVTVNNPDATLPGIMDFREQEITTNGTLILNAYNITSHDLTKMGGPADGFIANDMIYEIEIGTGQVLFQWSAAQHLLVSESRMPLPSAAGDGTYSRPYTPFLITSVQSVGDDYLLVSSRNLWTIFLISKKTGAVFWEFNGSGEPSVGDFAPLPKESQFSWQHHARAHDYTDDGFKLSLYDNHNFEGTTEGHPSRGLLFDVTLPPNSSVPPELLQAITPGESIATHAQGNMEILSNGNRLLGNGPIPLIVEYGPEGDVRWTGRYGYDNMAQSYRVYKAPWHATPRTWAPSLEVNRAEGGGLTGYVSWNGATEVEFWNVYNVVRGVRLEAIGRAKRQGFETIFDVPSRFNDTMCLVVKAEQNGVEVTESDMACVSIFEQ